MIGIVLPVFFSKFEPLLLLFAGITERLQNFFPNSTLIKGIVCTKNVKHKRMVSQHKNPRILLLGGALEYQRVSNKLASINTVMEKVLSCTS